MKFLIDEFYEDVDLEDDEDIIDILTFDDAEEIIERLVKKKILKDMGKDFVLSEYALDKILDYAEKRDDLNGDIFERILRGIRYLLDVTFAGASRLDENDSIRYAVVILDLGKFTDMFPTIREDFESMCPGIFQDFFEDYPDT